MVQAIREKNCSDGGKSMQFCIVIVYAVENILSYGHNLKIEIGGNGGHLKHGGRWICIQYFKKVIATILIKLLT